MAQSEREERDALREMRDEAMSEARRLRDRIAQLEAGQRATERLDACGRVRAMLDNLAQAYGTNDPSGGLSVDEQHRKAVEQAMREPARCRRLLDERTDMRQRIKQLEASLEEAAQYPPPMGRRETALLDMLRESQAKVVALRLAAVEAG